MASGLHEAVKGPASMPAVFLLCLLSGVASGGTGWSRGSLAQEKAEAVSKEVVELRVKVGVLEKANDDLKSENERRFAELSVDLKDLKRTVDKIAERVGARQ